MVETSGLGQMCIRIAESYSMATNYFYGYVSNTCMEYWFFNLQGQYVTVCAVVMIICFAMAFSMGFMDDLKDGWKWATKHKKKQQIFVEAPLNPVGKPDEGTELPGDKHSSKPSATPSGLFGFPADPISFQFKTRRDIQNDHCTGCSSNSDHQTTYHYAPADSRLITEVWREQQTAARRGTSMVEI